MKWRLFATTSALLGRHVWWVVTPQGGVIGPYPSWVEAKYGATYWHRAERGQSTCMGGTP